MHFSSLFLASLSAAATVKAAKGGNSIKFELGIIRADMELAVGAINGSVLANLPSEDKINCKDPARSGQTATFYLDKEALFLYSEGLNQEIYVDFSAQGMSTHIIGCILKRKKRSIACNQARARLDTLLVTSNPRMIRLLMGGRSPRTTISSSTTRT